MTDTSNDNIENFARFTEVDPSLVPLDIKPGSCPNPVIANRKGVLPVAILGTADFDATEVDLTTVTLEGVSPLRSNLEDVATPFVGDPGDCHELGGDGVIDLALKFDKQDVVAALGEVSDGDAIGVRLSGKLLDGTSFAGEDAVVIREKKIEEEIREK